MTVGRMLDEMTLEELNYWIVFHKIEREKFEKENEKTKKVNNPAQVASTNKRDLGELNPQEVMAMFEV